MMMNLFLVIIPDLCKHLQTVIIPLCGNTYYYQLPLVERYIVMVLLGGVTITTITCYVWFH